MPGGPRPMLLWYVWMHIVDGAWHKLDEISKQLRIPRNAVSWAAKFLTDHGMVELGFEEDEIRLHKTHLRLEDVVRTLQHSPKSDVASQGSSEVPTDL
ncbi:hypothetical protein E6H34_05160 [Candidatus Bathyarchaeota archaeon]|nr:MAG: hypothetical protein E6H34_05160 [Candidatus Bathyarchaeota archaeon]